MPQSTPPKADAVRRNARTGPTLLPAAGRKGDPPPWPGSDRPSEAEQEAWVQLWATPQAEAWSRLGIGTCREVARYTRLLVASEHPDAKMAVHAQVTVLADRLGLTPKAMRMLMWAIAVDEVSQQREATPMPTARGRIKAVG